MGRPVPIQPLQITGTQASVQWESGERQSPQTDADWLWTTYGPQPIWGREGAAQWKVAYRWPRDRGGVFSHDLVGAKGGDEAG